MQKKQILLTFFFISLILMSSGFGQEVKDIKIFSDYSIAGSKRLLVWNAKAVGGGAEINFNLIGGMSIGVSIGYQLFSVNQDSVIKQLNWDFWEYRYKGNIAVDLTDTTIKATLAPFEKMDVLPFKLSLNYDYVPTEGLTISPSLGGGILFFTRRIYIEETWQKYYPSAGYTFLYTYRNFAPKKSGNPFFLSGSINVTYNITELLSIYSGFNYSYIVPTEGEMGYDFFPFQNYYSIKLGLTFLY